MFQHLSTGRSFAYLKSLRPDQISKPCRKRGYSIRPEGNGFIVSISYFGESIRHKDILGFLQERDAELWIREQGK